MAQEPGSSPFRRVALVGGLFALFEVFDAGLAVLAKRFPVIARFRALQQKG